jgi:hypothetical protein
MNPKKHGVSVLEKGSVPRGMNQFHKNTYFVSPWPFREQRRLALQACGTRKNRTNEWTNK